VGKSQGENLVSILNRRSKVKGRALERAAAKGKGVRRHAVPIEAHGDAVPRQRAPKGQAAS
jgi:hypothetical protein